MTHRSLQAAMRLLFAAAALATPAAAQQSEASPFSLDDIQFWVGSGEHRAGIAIDWDGDDQSLPSSPTLAWGFRWDGDAVIEDALRELLAADDRLFAVFSPPGGFGVEVLGFGYDLNGDGEFGVGGSFGPDFDDTGLSIGGVIDNAAANDPGDAYREGFFIAGFWVLSTAPGPTAVGFNDTSAGITTVPLSADGWVGLSFSPSFNFDAQPNQIAAAEFPADLPLPGDFNADGRVDAADFTVWRDTSGDIEPYRLWREYFGRSRPPTGDGPPGFATLPEPTTASLVMAKLLAWLLTARRRPPADDALRAVETLAEPTQPFDLHS